MKRFISLFKASPVRPDYADGADLFRVLCVAFISWFHIWQQSWLNPNFTLFGHTVNLYPIVTCGYILVDSMILLSGFLLMLGALNGRARSKRNFFVSRIARILPCYYFFLLLQLALYIIPGNLFFNPVSGLIDTLSHLTFTHNLFPEGYIGTKFNGVLWTLAVEVQFYVLFPYVGRSFRKRPIRTWAVMVALAFFSRFYVARYNSDISLYFNRLPAMLDVYANGMMAALIWKRLSKQEPSTLRAWIATLLTIAACIAIYQLARRQRSCSDYTAIRQCQMDQRFMLSVAGCVLLIASGRSITLIRRLCSNRVTRVLSGISFNFYMWHQFIACRLKEWHIPAYTSESPNMDSEMPWQPLYTIACFAVGIAFSALLTYLFEKPCAKAIKKRFLLDNRAKKRYNDNQLNETEMKG